MSIGVQLCCTERRDQPHPPDGAAQPVRSVVPGEVSAATLSGHYDCPVAGAEHGDVHQDREPQTGPHQVPGRSF